MGPADSGREDHSMVQNHAPMTGPMLSQDLHSRCDGESDQLEPLPPQARSTNDDGSRFETIGESEDDAVRLTTKCGRQFIPNHFHHQGDPVFYSLEISAKANQKFASVRRLLSSDGGYQRAHKKIGNSVRVDDRDPKSSDRLAG